MFKRFTSLVIITVVAGCATPQSPEPTPVTIEVVEEKTEETTVLDEPVVSPEPATNSETDTVSQPIAKPPIKTVTIIATGDMMLGGTGTEFYQRDNYDYAFKNMRDILSEADIFIGNLETPLTTSDELLVEKKYRFKNPPEPVAAALARAGLDVANLANNHSLDYGYSGLVETRSALQHQGIKPIGAGSTLSQAREAAVINIDQTRVGFLAYSNTFPKEFWAEKDRPGTAFGHEHQIRADVAALKNSGVDIVAVSFHWGQEGATELREYQPLLAHAAIDAGADLIIGHHPHVLQAVEQYKQGIIFYSLGNFTFGSYSRRAKDSAIARIQIADKRLRRVELIPINVYNVDVLFQPTLLSESDAQRVIAELQTLSIQRGTSLQADGDYAVIEWPADNQ